jgi:hypothetical protein
LEQNYLSPFNPTAQIKSSSPESGHVSLKVYDLYGRQAATLFEDVRQPSNYKTVFNGGSLASGAYLYRMKAEKFAEIKKLILVR